MTKNKWEHVNFNDLPRSIKDLGEAIGQEAAFKLFLYFEEKGTKKFYVPSQFLENHPLIELIGETAFALLIDRFGGTYHPVPLGTKALNRAKVRLIKNGDSESSLQPSNRSKGKP